MNCSTDKNLLFLLTICDIQVPRLCSLVKFFISGQLVSLQQLYDTEQEKSTTLLLMQKGHTKARLEPQAPPKAHIMLSKYCTWPCLKESCIYSGSMLIADSTYCRRRWGGEWHHFLWQLYESSQQGGGCRLGDTAKPYSLSTCLLRTTSQLAVFAFQVFGEFMKSVFYWALFIFSLFLSSCSSSGPWMEGLCTVSFGPAEDDDLWP